jgi:hypothetical protein
MPIQKGAIFAQRDVFVDYPLEGVMYRWDHMSKKIYCKFYGVSEGTEPVPHDNRLFNDALLHGEEISEAVYRKGRRG